MSAGSKSYALALMTAVYTVDLLHRQMGLLLQPIEEDPHLSDSSSGLSRALRLGSSTRSCVCRSPAGRIAAIAPRSRGWPLVATGGCGRGVGLQIDHYVLTSHVACMGLMDAVWFGITSKDPVSSLQLVVALLAFGFAGGSPLLEPVERDGARPFKYDVHLQ